MGPLARAAAYVGLPLALAGAAVQWVVPPVMARVAAAAVSSWLGEGHYRVQLEASPRYRLLLGDFDRVEVEGTDLAAAGTIARLVVVLHDLRVDPWSLLLNRRLDAARAGRTSFRVELEEHDLAQHVRAQIPFEDVAITLRDGGFELQGRLPAVRGSARIELSGGFDIAAAGAQVRLTVDRLRVNDREVPALLVEQVLPRILQPGLVFDVSGLFPVPVRIFSVESEGGLLILAGEAEP